MSLNKPFPLDHVVVGLTPALTQRGEAHVDGGACCITPDGVCAIAEERLSRRKYAGGAEFAFRTVLAECGVEPRDVDRFYVSTCGERVPAPYAPVALSPDGSVRLEDLGVDGACVRWVPSHHLSHAHASFETSDLDRAIVVVMDDAGSAPQRYFEGLEPREAIAGELERTTCYLADKRKGYRTLAAIRAPARYAGGPGTMYRYVTDFLGLDGVSECGKTMALAAYGQPEALADLKLLKRSGVSHVAALRRRPTESKLAVQERLERIGLGHIGPRDRGGRIDAIHEDLARHAQQELEEAVTVLVQHLIDATGIGDVCLSGGMALNCVTVGKLMLLPGVASVHVATAPGDTGQPLGNCLYGLRQAGITCPTDAFGPYLGPGYSEARIGRACDVWGNGLRISRGGIAEKVAEAVAGGRVVATFHGKSEVGPRALGHRSILADPRRNDMQDYLNRIVKGREEYRPYGVAVLASATERLFGRLMHSPSMTVAAPLTTHWQCRIPAVRHVDGTSRFQTLGPRDDPWLREIVETFDAITGVPAVLNTSFNTAGQPIVESPEDALTTFLHMNLDALAIEDWYIEK